MMNWTSLKIFSVILSLMSRRKRKSPKNPRKEAGADLGVGTRAAVRGRVLHQTDHMTAENITVAAGNV